nr:DNA-3-methyladenine glycosylase [Motilibacter deserti]
MTAFPRETLRGPAPDVAPALLGAHVVSDSPAGRVVVRLTEVEAYAGEADPGSHAFRGRTRRNVVMFGDAGFLYVYFTYGMHWCANVVCGVDGAAAAVLLRAGEVVAGAALARTRRPAARSDVELARGPARLCSALGVGRESYGLDLLDPASPVRLLAPALPVPPDDVAVGPRVGVTAGAETPWRFWIASDPTVSAYRAHVPRRRTSGGRRTGESSA